MRLVRNRNGRGICYLSYFGFANSFLIYFMFMFLRSYTFMAGRRMPEKWCKDGGTVVYQTRNQWL